jgi:stage V sporulation protein G
VEITEVRVHLVSSRRSKLRAFATLIFDRCFVVRNVKLIDHKGGLLVAMPSKPRTARCQACSANNSILARYCNACGCRLRGPGSIRPKGNFKDLAHPITSEFRRLIERKVLEAYESAAPAALPAEVPETAVAESGGSQLGQALRIEE